MACSLTILIRIPIQFEDSSLASLCVLGDSAVMGRKGLTARDAENAEGGAEIEMNQYSN